MHTTIYTTTTCSDCPGAIRRLRKHGVEPTIIDVTADPQAYELIAEMGYRRVPVIVRRDDAGEIADHWQGHRPDKLLQIDEP